jgi:hypothetical protein
VADDRCKKFDSMDSVDHQGREDQLIVLQSKTRKTARGGILDPAGSSFCVIPFKVQINAMRAREISAACFRAFNMPWQLPYYLIDDFLVPKIPFFILIIISHTNDVNHENTNAGFEREVAG